MSDIELLNQLLSIVKNQQNRITELENVTTQNIDMLHPIFKSFFCKKINKEKVSYELSLKIKAGFCGTSKSDRNPKLIVSLTSYPDRMYDIKYALFSLLSQSLKPDMVILWLAEEQFPNKENDISDEILQLKNHGLTIKWCNDIKSYKKLIPALKEYPNDIIVTADDDIYYPENWLETLYSAYLENPDYIYGHRGRIVAIKDNSIQPYSEWYLSNPDLKYSAFNFLTTGGGVIFPPYSLNSFHDDILDDALFMELSPTADDIWFWAMCILNNKKINILNIIDDITYVNPERELGFNPDKTLYSINSSGGNDKAIENIVNHYPEIIDKLK